VFPYNASTVRFDLKPLIRKICDGGFSAEQFCGEPAEEGKRVEEFQDFLRHASARNLFQEVISPVPVK
jgi:hypothetical protein